MPHESFAIIVGGIWFAVELKCCGFVVDGRRGGDNGLHVIHGIVKRRRIHKRLEDGSRLAVRQGVIELALPVISSADKRFNLPIPWIERYQRRLRLGNRFVASLLCQLLLPLLISLR